MGRPKKDQDAAKDSKAEDSKGAATEDSKATDDDAADGQKKADQKADADAAKKADADAKAKAEEAEAEEARKQAEQDAQDAKDLEEAKALDAARAKAEKAAGGDERIVPQKSGNVESTDEHLDMLMEACNVYGIDPRLKTKPRELLNWAFDRGDEIEGIPASVTLVTGGGQKLRHPMDQDTEDRLRRLLGAMTTDPKTKEVVNLPLPDDLTLPDSAVTGQVSKTSHRYERGYLREGGRLESNRRAAQQRKAKRGK